MKQLQEWRLRTVVLLWVCLAVVVLAILGVSNPAGFKATLEGINSVITFVLAPLAILSVVFSFWQWKEQKDREAGYEQLHPRDVEKGIEVAESALEEEEEDEPEEEEESEFEPLHELTIFRTSKQQTKLCVTGGGVSCSIIDNRPGRGGHQWSMSKEEIRRVLHEQQLATSSYKERTGLLSIGRRRNWLYSHNLFPNKDILRQVRRLLETSIESE